MFFEITGTDSHTRARLGSLRTSRGSVTTPVFMPVGTVGSVKSLDPSDLAMMGFELILANAYHLTLRPGHQTVEKLGGLHRFMGWNKSILTDSGGFQVFSLATLRSLDDEGVEFSNHLDGARLNMTPESSLEIQRALGSDLVMPLDDCPPYPADSLRLEDSVRRTTLWARRSRKVKLGPGQKLFGIVQGGMIPALRKRSAEEIADLQFDGYALGGIGVGEPPALGQEVVSAATSHLPEEAPRYVMGIGTPYQLVDMIGEGSGSIRLCVGQPGMLEMELFSPPWAGSISRERNSGRTLRPSTLAAPAQLVAISREDTCDIYFNLGSSFPIASIPSTISAISPPW